MVELVKSPSMKENKSPPSGRVLFCRKCECHGLQVILKGHAPKCPYELCNCHACEKLMNKRMRSFEKRNGELIKSALKAKKNQNSSSLSPHSSCSDTDQEMQSNGKPMTVMSYEIWKQKCAQEKKEREANKKENPIPIGRKRTYPFGDEGRDFTPSPSTVRGTYVNLPTIPPMRVLVDGDKKIIISEPRGISPTLSVHSTPSASISSPSPSSRPRLSSLPLPSSLSSSLHPPNPLSSFLPSSSSDHSHPRLSTVSSSTTVSPSLRPTIAPSLPPTIGSSIPPTVSSTASSLTPSDISSILQTMPTSILLRNCALNHERLQKGLPMVSLTQPMPPPPTVSLPTHSVESSLLSQLATLISSQSQSVPLPPPSIPSIPSITSFQSLPQIPSSISSFLVPSISLPSPKLDPSALSPEILQLLNQNLVQYLSQ